MTLFNESNLNISFCNWIDRFESVIADMCMLNGRQRDKLCCRSDGPRLVFQPAVGKPGSVCPRVSLVTVAWRSLDNWLADIMRGRNTAAASAASRKAARAAWHIQFHSWGSIWVVAFMPGLS